MPQVQCKQVRSIYFGGGTPTILSETQISNVMDLITKSFDIHNECEICFEVRPGKELTKEKLILLKELGVNRISIGCQSTDDNVLKINGRNLMNQEFLNSYQDITDVGFMVRNVDIMSGMVNQSFESWDNTIQDMIKLNPENIAIYKLEIYLNNQLYKRFRNGEISIISDDEEIRYIRHGIEQLLKAGYKMADNFTFVKDMSFDHIHRRRTWLGEDMLGVGLSAHSCFNDIIFQNEPNMQEYKQKTESGTLPIFRS
jgi:oxygen-independent coproporphyrinogen-3 oxidase